MDDKREAIIAILGAGWLGLPLGRRLKALGYQVSGATTSAEKLPALRAAGLRPFLLRISENGRISGEEVELFFAADILILNIPPGRRSSDVEARYPRQIRAAIDAAQAQEIPRLLFFSSTGVYGDLCRVVTEADPPAPTRGAGRALAVAENEAMARAGGQTSILRLAGLVGDEREPGRFLAGKVDLDNGNAPVNLVHRDDCIGVVEAVLRQAAWGQVFNVCADEHPSREAFYTARARKAGLPPPRFSPQAEGPWKIVSNKKVKQKLGYVFRYPDPMDFP
jgi:nucleoside-diphosphate-sugar epimerase